jgi:TetR/AcrR family transcriptional regulator, regulator of cefoperazone and chloramphenicol sensitivity
MDRPVTNTRQRLLEAASKLFAEKGFGGATVAAICRKAQANIASVNYHFGNKGNLYREAWRHARASTMAAFPSDGGVGAEAAPQQRLRGRMRAILQRALDGEALEVRIMNHEMARPTGLLRQVVQDTIGPLRQATREILTELLGPRADELTIQSCMLLVIGPCMQVARRQQMRKYEGVDSALSADTLEAMLDRFVVFALAGIEEIRRQIERGTLGQPLAERRLKP